jgi:hypothetical protein
MNMRDMVYEQALKNQGATWIFVEKVRLDDIDIAKSLRNQARLIVALDPELVEGYALADKRDDQFPPLVLWRPTPRSKYILIDGNQRCGAYLQNRREHANAYLVRSGDPLFIKRLTYRFNNLVNGRRLSKEETMEHAIEFVRSVGWNVKYAAQEFEVSQGTLQSRIRAAEIKEKLEKANVKNIQRISETSYRYLGSFEQLGDDVLVKAAKVVIDNGLGEKEMTHMAGKVKEANTHEKKLKAIETYAASPEVRARREQTKGGQRQPVRPDPRSRFARAMLELQHLMEDYKEKSVLLPATKEGVKEMCDVAIDIVEGLTIRFGLGALPQRKEA